MNEREFWRSTYRKIYTMFDNYLIIEGLKEEEKETYIDDIL